MTKAFLEMAANPDPRRESVTVKVFESDHIYDYELPAGNLLASIAFLTEKLHAIPEEFRGSAALKIESSGDGYGCYWVEASISYDRQETDDEMATRFDKATRQKLQREAQERATYEALKAKFN